MSTPRTDESASWQSEGERVSAEFARTLERELAAALAERDAARAGLIACADYHHNLWGDEAGTSWREQQNERAESWRKAAGLGGLG